jgi:hypothetical protein
MRSLCCNNFPLYDRLFGIPEKTLCGRKNAAASVFARLYPLFTDTKNKFTGVLT